MASLAAGRSMGSTAPAITQRAIHEIERADIRMTKLSHWTWR